MDAEKIKKTLFNSEIIHTENHGDTFRCDNIMRAMNSYESLIESLTKELQEAREDVKEFEHVVGELQKDLDLYAARETESENYVKELQEEIKGIANKCLELTSNNRELQKEISELKRLDENGTAINEQLNGYLIERGNKIESLQSQITSKEEENVKQVEIMFNLQDEINSLKFDRDSYKESFENLKKDISNRVAIAKEWLYEDPYRDVEAAVDVLTKIEALLNGEERKGE